MDGQRYAILIGNSKFPASNKRLPDLNCPETDVDGLAEILSSEELGGFSTIVPLKNLSHHEVLEEIGKVFDLASKDDLVLIYYSGHGKQDSEGQLYLATVNTRTITANALTSSSIPVESIRRFIKHSSVQTTVLILDCCYSGAVEGAFIRGGADEQLQNVSKTRGTYIITASTGLQTAVEKEGDKYGLLTKYIFKGIREGLADHDKDGWVHMDELYDYIYKAVTHDGAQEPMKWAINIKGDQLKIARAGRNEQIQARINTLTQEGQQAQALEDWQTAIQKFTQIKELDPTHQASIWLLQAKEQQKLANWYMEGLKYLDARNWSKALESFQRIITVDTRYKETLNFIEIAKQEIRAEAVTSGLSEADQAIAKEDWDSAINKLVEVLSLAPDNDQARGVLSNVRNQKEVLDLYNKGLSHYDARRWREAWMCFDQIRNKTGEYKDVSHLLNEIERIEAEEEERLRAKEEATVQQANKSFDEAKEAIAAQDWDEAARLLYEISALERKGNYINDKLAETQLVLMHAQQQQAIDSLYDIGLEHYKARRWREAWMCFDQIRNKTGEYKDVSSLLREVNDRRARAYILKLYAAAGFVLFSCLIITFSVVLIWWNHFILPRYTNLLPVFAGIILLLSLYLFLKLSKDSDNLRQEISRLRLGYLIPGGNIEKAAQEISALNSTDLPNWRITLEEKLSQRLSSLTQVDDTREIDLNFITCAEYQLFINEAQMQNKAHHTPDHWAESIFPAGTGSQPISGITVQDALRLCEWLNERSGNQVTYRLPTSEEAIKFPSSELAIASWCTQGSKYELVGLSAINKRTISRELTKLAKFGLPMPSSLSKRLVTKMGGGQIIKSMGRALASLRFDFDPNEFIYDFHTATYLKFTSALALASLENLARAMDLHGWGTWNTENIGTLTPSLQALKANDLAKLRKLAESLVESYRPVASSTGSLVIALVDIITAKTIIEKRRAQRVYALRILACAYVGYSSLINAVVKKDSRSRLKRWLRPAKYIEDEKISLENDRTQVAEVYWYWRIVMAREANELPSWEGIRIVREKSIK